MNESKGVIWFNYLDQDGNKESITLRQLDKEGDEEFLGRVQNWKQSLKESGYTPLSAPNAGPPPKVGGAYVPPKPTKATTSRIGAEILILDGKTKGGDQMFKIKGGWATLHGIRCYIEPLEAAGLLDDIRAFFTENGNDAEFPFAQGFYADYSETPQPDGKVWKKVTYIGQEGAVIMEEEDDGTIPF